MGKLIGVLPFSPTFHDYYYCTQAGAVPVPEEIETTAAEPGLYLHVANVEFPHVVRSMYPQPSPTREMRLSNSQAVPGSVINQISTSTNARNSPCGTLLHL